jgi:hypothetical protein
MILLGLSGACWKLIHRKNLKSKSSRDTGPLSARFSRFMTFVHPSPSTSNQQIPAEQLPKKYVVPVRDFRMGKSQRTEKNCCFNCTPGSACDRREGSLHSPEPEKIKRFNYTIYYSHEECCGWASLWMRIRIRLVT